MKSLLFLLYIFTFSILSCNYERNSIIEESDDDIGLNFNWIENLKMNTHCGYIDWRGFPLIIGIQYDKIVLSGVNISKKGSSKNTLWGKPDSITYFDENIYDDMSADFEKWHYGESIVILANNEISDFYINENNFVLNKPIYVEIGKSKCDDFMDYINCECVDIMDGNGNGTIIINIIAPEVLIVTDAHLYFIFEEHNLTKFGLNSRLF